MSEPKKDNLISVFVDGQEVRVEPGTNMVEAAARVGREVPHYCYHPKLSVVGNCRMCLVEMGLPGRDRTTGQPMLDADGKPVIQWMPKPAIACATTASPGLHIRTDSPAVKECREGVMEFLLVNHPLDCPICDQAGECRLQEFATDYGRGFSRFIEQKNVKPKRTRIGPRVMLDDERCILCSRCIRFCDEIIGESILGFTDRGSYSTLGVFPGKQLTSNYSLNTVDLCPVGALTSTDFRFKMRVWFLKETPGIDTESSVGCNTLVGSREGVIYRITPRRNDAVNDTWMPDSGRMLYKQVDSDDRLTEYRLDGKVCGTDDALAAADELLKAGGVAIVGSGRLSVEEQYLLRRIANAIGADVPVYLVSRTDEGDGMLISADRNPNVRGALLTGLIQALPEARLDALAAAIDNGDIRTVLTVGEDLTAAGVAVEQLRKVAVINVHTHHSDTAQYSKVDMPLLTVFEKSGTFINQQFRVQKFAQAVPGPKGVLFGLSTFTRLYRVLTGEEICEPTAEAVWKLMAAEIPECQGLSFRTIPANGQLLDGSRYAGLPFIEGKTLHFEPSAAVVAQA